MNASRFLRCFFNSRNSRTVISSGVLVSPLEVVCSLVRSGRVVIRYKTFEPKLWYVSEYGSIDESFINLLAVFQSKFKFSNHLPNSPCARSFSLTCFNLRLISKID